MAHSDCVGVQVKLRNPLRTRAIPERFCGGDSLRRGAVSSVCTFTFYLNEKALKSLEFIFRTSGAGTHRHDMSTCSKLMLGEKELTREWRRNVVSYHWSHKLQRKSLMLNVGPVDADLHGHRVEDMQHHIAG